MALKAFLLENPFVWKMSRIALDTVFGLYRRRFGLLEQCGILAGDPSILDIGCGTGQYSVLTRSRYLGIDLNARYIHVARKRHRAPNRDFQCVDMTRLWEAQERFDIVLLVDFLHHIGDDHAVRVLAMAAQLARRHVVSFEPLTHQTNPFGRWIVDHDQCHFMRPLAELESLFQRAALGITHSTELRLGPITTRAILCDVRA
jgi:2-polyprenyl-3-methyl-5-hydroxy-6-metoxy-1,4-benzoquinol methylase